MTAPLRRLRAPTIDFDTIRAELDVPPDFTAQSLAEVTRDPAPFERVDLTSTPFVTVDPPGARDLDQAVHLVRDGAGFLLRYAIADVGAFVAPGSALDADAHRRGVTIYLPDGKLPLHPPALSEGAASLLAGQVRPAVVWTIRTDADAAPVDIDVRRALVRSTAQLSYPDVEAGTCPEALAGLADFGRIRAERVLARGGIDLDLPEQEVEPTPDGGWKLVLRAQTPAERHNAQVSLLTGECAAMLMLRAGVGLLRTVPPAQPADVDRVRRAAAGLGVDWPPRASPGRVVASVDAADPRGAAFLDLAATLLRGSAYTAFADGPPAQPLHARGGGAIRTRHRTAASPGRPLCARGLPGLGRRNIAAALGFGGATRAARGDGGHHAPGQRVRAGRDRPDGGRPARRPRGRGVRCGRGRGRRRAR